MNAFSDELFKLAVQLAAPACQEYLAAQGGQAPAMRAIMFAYRAVVAAEEELRKGD